MIKRAIMNPFVLYTIVWLLTLMFYQMRLSLILQDLNISTVYFIILSCFVFGLSWAFMLLAYRKRLKRAEDVEYEIPNIVWRRLKTIFLIWALFSLFEVIKFKGLPLLGLRYTEFGIASLHGFLNSLIIVISNYVFYLYIKTKKRIYLMFFLAILVWPILLLSRQVLISMLVQSLFVYVIFSKIKKVDIVKSAVIVLLVIVAFGVLGNIRTGNASFVNLVRPSENYPGFMPAGFLWVYIYLVSPLNNLNFNINAMPGFNMHFGTLFNMFPTVIRSMIGYDSPTIALVNSGLNTTSFHAPFISDYGVYGTLFVYFIMGVIFSYVYIKAIKTKNIKWAFILIVILHNIVLSVFTNFFTHAVFIFQIMVHYFIGTRFVFKEKEPRNKCINTAS